MYLTFIKSILILNMKYVMCMKLQMDKVKNPISSSRRPKFQCVKWNSHCKVHSSMFHAQNLKTLVLYTTNAAQEKCECGMFQYTVS